MKTFRKKPLTMGKYHVIMMKKIFIGVMKVIYVTGDTHSEFNRFKNKLFHASADDTVIICGDFGGLWDNSPTEHYWLKWLCEKPYQILFCDGNHENYDMINACPVENLFGGKVHKISDNIYHLMRGEVFEIEGKKFFVMGGARSHDTPDGILNPLDKDFNIQERMLIRRGKKRYRVKGVSWWEEEMPNEKELTHALETLSGYDFKVDYIITHECPTDVHKIVVENYVEENRRHEYRPDELTDFFQTMSGKCEFKKWFFGHYHADAEILEKFRVIEKDIIALG